MRGSILRGLQSMYITRWQEEEQRINKSQVDAQQMNKEECARRLVANIAESHEAVSAQSNTRGTSCCVFVQALVVSQILTFQMFNLENVDQGHRVQYSQWTIWWQISMSTKVVNRIFALTLIFSEILTFQIFDLENLDQGHNVEYSQWCQFDGKYLTFYIMAIALFALSQVCSISSLLYLKFALSHRLRDSRTTSKM